MKLGRVLDKYKVGKHFELTITDTAVKYQILEPQVAAEAALDGIYVIRTGLPKKQMSGARRRAQLQGAHPGRARVPLA